MSKLAAVVLGCLAGFVVPQAAGATSGLTPVRVSGQRQTSGCELIGKAFGSISVGGKVIFNGRAYPIERVHSADNEAVYSGPNVRVVFRPKVGNKLQEGADGEPYRLTRPEPRGIVRVEVAGNVVATSASEHCVIFE
jgi:hypothetical protein